jgi:hypothetical protein
MSRYGSRTRTRQAVSAFGQPTSGGGVNAQAFEYLVVAGGGGGPGSTGTAQGGGGGAGGLRTNVVGSTSGGGASANSVQGLHSGEIIAAETYTITVGGGGTTPGAGTGNRGGNGSASSIATTSYNNNIRKQYAGIGYTYDAVNDVFIHRNLTARGL